MRCELHRFLARVVRGSGCAAAALVRRVVLHRDGWDAVSALKVRRDVFAPLWADAGAGATAPRRAPAWRVLLCPLEL